MTDALILFAHGSRDPRWAAPFEAVQARVTGALPGTPVHLAYLEFMTPDLGTAIEAVAAGGARHVVIVPLFLGQGGHLRNDLPRLVADAAKRHPGIAVRLANAAGEAAPVLDALAGYCVTQARTAPDRV